MKKLPTLCLVLAMLMSLCVCGFVPASAEAAEEEPVFADWNGTAPALQALVDYVEAVTDEASPDYIPPEDRIAVFDIDCVKINWNLAITLSDKIPEYH